VPGFEQPFIMWVPAVAPSGMTFYTGDRFPRWKGSLFIGVLKYMSLERHVFNAKGQPFGGITCSKISSRESAM
jgi:glucose/arabinose dehydrogenase